MGLIRFRVRTLMAAVVIAAGGCWVVRTAPVLLVVLAPIAGPMLASLWLGHRSGGRCESFLWGGLAGAAIECTGFAIWGLARLAFYAPSEMPTLSWILSDWIIGASLFGMVIGPFAIIISIAVWLGYHWFRRTPADCPGARRSSC